MVMGEWCDECGDEKALMYETDDGQVLCYECKYCGSKRVYDGDE